MALIATLATQNFMPTALWEQLVKLLGSEMSRTLVSFIIRQLLAVLNL